MSKALSLPVGRARRLAVDPLLPATGLAFAVFLLLAVLSSARVAAYHAGVLDLDIQDQVIWNTAHGRPFASTVLKENSNHLAEHLAFSLTPFAALYAVAPDTRLLVIAQALALAGSSLAVYLYARRRLNSDLHALVIQLSYLAMPLLAVIAFDDFHPVALAAVPLAFGAYLLFVNLRAPGLALLALAVLAEEEAALPAIGLGLVLVWRGSRKLGLVLSCVAALYLLAATQIVLPAFQAHTAGNGDTNRTLAHFGQARGDLSTLLYRFRSERLWDASTWLVIPSGGTALLSPVGLFPALPTFSALMVQDEDLGNRYRMHWAAVMLPFIGFAAADGVRRLSRTPLARYGGVGLVAAGTLVSYAMHSPLPGSAIFDLESFEAGAHQRDIAQALRLVPTDSPILASGSIVAYLNHRPQIYVYPPSLHYAEGVADGSKRIGFAVLDLYDRSTQHAISLKALSPMRREPPPILLAPAHKMIFLMDTYPRPGISASDDAVFGGMIQLDGYDVAQEGDTLVLTLQWRAVDRDYFSYNRFLDLVTSDGTTVASDSEMQLLYFAPTNDWRPGQRIVDRVEFPLPRTAGVPEYRFRVSWRTLQENPSPSSRLLLPDGTDAYLSPRFSNATS